MARGYVNPRTLLLISAAVIVMAATGCDPSHEVTYENRTSYTVTVFLNGGYDATLGPFESYTSDVIKYVDATTFEARDENGRTIFSESLTYEELENQEWKIIITEEAAPGSPTPTPEARRDRRSEGLGAIVG